MKNLDKYRGCLIGGAAGDALGYAVEFMREPEIFAKYGEKGITEYKLYHEKARISDDTQMTLFTANGLLLGRTKALISGTKADYTKAVYLCYKDWYRTQEEDFPVKESLKKTHSWLMNIPDLFSLRAPGNSCLSALRGEKIGTIEDPINISKGCGGVMRVAPIGLFFDGKEPSREPLSIEEIDRIGAEAAALTHGHPLGYIPAAALVHLVHLLANSDISLKDAVMDMRRAMEAEFAGANYLDYFLKLMDKAVILAEGNLSDLDAIHQLGEGWVAEETLAIAVYCALKYGDDFDKAIIASVNHKGDSDSTGAVAGNILGAYLGLEKIPKKYIDHLELREVILEIADDLYMALELPKNAEDLSEKWKQKYGD